MGFSFSLLMDPGDVMQFTAFCDAVGRRTAREELVPILQRHLEPLVASEKAFLGSHSQSGALAASLSARSGSGDRPGTISVFAAATATAALLRKTWGKHGRAQQRGWARDTKGRRRRMVSYADFVEKGHRNVGVNAQGQQYEKKGPPAKAVPFAAQAVAALGDAEAEAAANEVLDYILGGK